MTRTARLHRSEPQIGSLVACNWDHDACRSSWCALAGGGVRTPEKRLSNNKVLSKAAQAFDWSGATLIDAEATTSRRQDQD